MKSQFPTQTDKQTILTDEQLAWCRSHLRLVGGYEVFKEMELQKFKKAKPC